VATPIEKLYKIEPWVTLKSEHHNSLVESLHYLRGRLAERGTTTYDDELSVALTRLRYVDSSCKVTTDDLKYLLESGKYSYLAFMELYHKTGTIIPEIEGKLDELKTYYDYIVYRLGTLETNPYRVNKDHNELVQLVKLIDELVEYIPIPPPPPPVAIPRYIPIYGTNRITYCYVDHPMETFKGSKLAETMGDFNHVGVDMIFMKDEINIIASLSDGSALKVFNALDLTERYSISITDVYGGFTVVDIDDDGLAEIYIITSDWEKTYANIYDHSGSFITKKIIEEQWWNIDFKAPCIPVPKEAITNTLYLVFWWSVIKIDKDGNVVYSYSGAPWSPYQPLMLIHKDWLIHTYYDWMTDQGYVIKREYETGDLVWEVSEPYKEYHHLVAPYHRPTESLINFIAISRDRDTGEVLATRISDDGSILGRRIDGIFVRDYAVVLDMNGDGYEETLIWSPNRVDCYLLNSQTLETIAVMNTFGYTPSGIVGVDYEGNGKFNAVVSIPDLNKLVIYDDAGNIVLDIDTSAWFNRYFPTIRAIADIDNDGYAELIVSWEDADGIPYLATIE